MNISQIKKIIDDKLRIRPRDNPPYVGLNRKTTRNTIYELFNEFGYTYGAEIGVRRGGNAVRICRAVSNVKLILVDPWDDYSRSISTERAERYYQKTKSRMKNYDAIFMRMTSMKAVKHIDKSTLDFIYIDALHDFDNVMLDLIHWVPKVKIGGIISGHDYCHRARTGVVRAVDAYTLAHGIKYLYVTREPVSSFFWVKQ